MNGQMVLDKIMDTYRPNFDVEEPYEFHGEVYDAYAGFSMTSAKYVLVKRAELWRAHCFEHAFFQCREEIHAGDLLRFQEQLLEHMEPELGRGGEAEPVKDHMYTYLTGVFVSEKAVSPETLQTLKKLKFRKNYRFAVRGFSEERLVLLDMENRRIYGNPAAKDLIKGYKKMVTFQYPHS